MSQVSKIRMNYREAAIRGYIPEGVENRLTMMTILEAGIQAFHRGYFKDLLDLNIDKSREQRISNREGWDMALAAQDAMLEDISGVRWMHRQTETLTTSDFALALAYTRDAAQKPGYAPFESELLKAARTRDVANFKPIKARGATNLLHRFLALRPEATNVLYTGFIGQGEVYSVANYELAIAYTWEMFVNDEIGDFVDAMEELGEAAARTRAWSVIDAVARMAPRLPLLNGELGPTVENIQAVQADMAEQQIDGRTVSRTVTDLYLPTVWGPLARVVLGSQALAYTGGGATVSANPPMNPVYQAATAHNEPIMSEIFVQGPEGNPRYNNPAAGYADLSARDWVALDRNARGLEIAYLDGFRSGPKTYTKIPDTVELNQGSFENHTYAVKVGDVHGATVADKSAVRIVQGV
ncbi:hypothetical protein ACFOPQ_01265 [Deinococcus antarcticus]|uniref:RagB/SusD family nutrient uptake outer membrane protein n=1 Tax=Deinococcus antarcticus TaxID=1298767 RepID=A0ABV8A137_9DEIO